MRNSLLIVLAGVSFVSSVGAQAPPRIWQGVYTVAQADRGKAAFSTTCLRCHNADLSGDRGPALKGERFQTSWGGGPVTRLFEKIRDTMPPFATSTLDDNTKLDIVTFILQTNGFPAGEKELAVADLESIDIVAQGEVPKVQNFSRVQVVGCLARGETDKWVLTNASEPVAEGSASPDGGSAAGASRAAGAGRFVLLNATPFDPATQLGKRVDVRGLIYREGADSLLTVGSLKAIGTCP